MLLTSIFTSGAKICSCEVPIFFSGWQRSTYFRRLPTFLADFSTSIRWISLPANLQPKCTSLLKADGLRIDHTKDSSSSKSTSAGHLIRSAPAGRIRLHLADFLSLSPSATYQRKTMKGAQHLASWSQFEWHNFTCSTVPSHQM